MVTYTPVYGTAEDYAAFWCISSIMAGGHDGGIGVPSLLDNDIDFLAMGFIAGAGQVLYNLTQGTHGPITYVDEHTMTATGVTWNTNDLYSANTLKLAERSTIDLYLSIAASDIASALASNGAYGCTLAAWAAGYLSKLNIIDAAIYHNCPCGAPTLTDDMKKTFLTWISTQIDNLRTGKVEVCAGQTGAEFPFVSWAEHSFNEFNAAHIIINDMLRNS